MNGYKQEKIILTISIPLTVLIIIISCGGIFIPGMYAKETANWSAQAFGQDIFDLFLVMPFLIITAVLAYKNNRTALLLWGGAAVYLIYTFLIYCFALHYNNFFILYCITLGLSFYSFIYFLLSLYKKDIGNWFNEKVPVKSTGIFLIIFSVMFYFLWLTEIIPAIIGNTFPKSVKETGLLINPVHAIDLSLMLPALFITGILLLKKNPLGLLLAAPILVFDILMSVTIAGLVIIMNIKGVPQDLSVTAIMGVMIVINIILLIRFISTLEPHPVSLSLKRRGKQGEGLKGEGLRGENGKTF